MKRTLVDFPYVAVRIGCSRCARQGKYRLARLAEEHGADINLVELLSRISADCPIKRRENDPGLERCGALFLDLRGGPAPDEPPASKRGVKLAD
jgi:hypothetical protein